MEPIIAWNFTTYLMLELALEIAYICNQVPLQMGCFFTHAKLPWVEGTSQTIINLFTHPCNNHIKIIKIIMCSIILVTNTQFNVKR